MGDKVILTKVPDDKSRKENDSMSIKEVERRQKKVSCLWDLSIHGPL